MKGYLFFLLFLFLLSPQFSAQVIDVPGIALENIEFNISGSEFPDSINSVRLFIISEDITEEYFADVSKGSFNIAINIPETGTFSISAEGYVVPSQSFRVIPGLLSVIPPLLAIILALIFRQVILSLIFGIYVGAVFIYDYNPLTGLLRLADKYVINAISDVSHIHIIVFTLLFGGVIGLISRSGGTRGIANVLTRFAKTRKSGMISTWLSGIIIFFDDYANSLVVGNLMRPVTDKLKISREKLSFIVDATAAPVASVFIVSSWIGYEVGLIQDGFDMIGSQANAYTTFLATIPYRFYPIAMLFFVFLIAVSKRDFGAMYKAERRAVEEGKVSNEDADNLKNMMHSTEILSNEEKAKWYNGVIPILVIIIGTIIGLIYTGINSLQEQGITDYNIQDIVANSDSYRALLWGSFSACVIAAIMIISQRIMNLKETIDAWFLGIRSMLLAIIILTLAWAIGSVTSEIKTADYIISLIGDVVNPRFLPVIVFVVCGVTSFATGTSWGTMAIMFPIVIPLAATVTGMQNYNPQESTLILNGAISSVLAGCVWGDHCSPISDTTILSSMASGCNHIDHVRTQLPYAIVVGVVCMIFGDVLSAYGLSPYISLLIISTLLVGIVYLFGKKL
ncbi:MAG: Na+/H+ antiporter NhaC family protein [Ignavibacteriae bacterium]|nr:MAG: Na+/H+ antiporter NhaC family protein [Ignavibacteriota bacterium]